MQLQGRRFHAVDELRGIRERVHGSQLDRCQVHVAVADRGYDHILAGAAVGVLGHVEEYVVLVSGLLVAILVDVLGDDPGVERAVSAVLLLDRAIADVARANDDQLARPQRADVLGVGDFRRRVLRVGHRHCRLAQQLAAIERGVGELEDRRAIVQRHEARQHHVTATAAEHVQHRHIIGMYGVDAVAHVVVIHARVDEAVVSELHVLQLDRPVGVVGDVHQRDDRLVVHGDRTFDVAVQIGEARHVVVDVVDDDLTRIAGIPDVRVVLDAHGAHVLLVLVGAGFDVDARGSVAQVEHRILDRVGMGANKLAAVVGLLAHEAAGALLVVHAAAGIELKDVGFQLGADVFQAINVQSGRIAALQLDFRVTVVILPHVQVAAGLGLADRVQLDAGEQVDVGVAVFRQGGSIQQRLVMADDARVADDVTGVQAGAGVVHRQDLRAQGGALGVGVHVFLQLADDGGHVDLPALDLGPRVASVAAGRVCVEVHVGGQIQLDLAVHLGVYAQAGGIRPAGHPQAGLRGVRANGHGVEAIRDPHALADVDLGGRVDFRGVLDVAQVNHAAAADRRAGDDGILDVVEAAAHLADDVQVAIVGGEHRTVGNIDDAGAGQPVEDPQPVAFEEPAAVGVGLGAHRHSGVGADVQAALCRHGTVDVHLAVGFNDVAAVSDVGAGQEADARAVGNARRHRAVLGANGDVSVGFHFGGIHNRVALVAPVLHIGFGPVVALGGQLRDAFVDQRHDGALFNAGHRVACVLRHHVYIAASGDLAAADTGGHSLRSGLALADLGVRVGYLHARHCKRSGGLRNRPGDRVAEGVDGHTAANIHRSADEGGVDALAGKCLGHQAAGGNETRHKGILRGGIRLALAAVGNNVEAARVDRSADVVDSGVAALRGRGFGGVRVEANKRDFDVVIVLVRAGGGAGLRQSEHIVVLLVVAGAAGLTVRTRGDSAGHIERVDDAHDAGIGQRGVLLEVRDRLGVVGGNVERGRAELGLLGPRDGLNLLGVGVHTHSVRRDETVIDERSVRHRVGLRHGKVGVHAEQRHAGQRRAADGLGDDPVVGAHFDATRRDAAAREACHPRGEVRRVGIVVVDLGVDEHQRGFADADHEGGFVLVGLVVDVGVGFDLQHTVAAADRGAGAAEFRGHGRAAQSRRGVRAAAVGGNLNLAVRVAGRGQ